MVQTLLETMTEISSILYARPELRCPRAILRLHNQTFLHAISCEEVIGKPQILSQKKFYGRYFHSLVAHAPIQQRIICLRSTNTEQQERHFNAFSSISLATSSRRPGEIITPGIIRIQAEMKSEENKQRDTVKEQESRLGKLTRCLPPAQNTIIPHRVILKYPYAYQAHLEKIADFLLCGEGIWWRHIVSGVEFLDGPEEMQGNDNGPPLHHFRTCTLKSEEQYLKNCWKECIMCDIPIPHHAVRIYDEEGNLQSIKHTGFLQDDDCSDSSDDQVLEEVTGNETNDCVVQDEDEDIEHVVGLQQVGEDLIDASPGDNLEDDDDTEEFPLAEEQAPSTELVAGAESTTSSPIHVENITVPFQLKSTLAKNVSKVLGETDAVRRLDMMRTRLRNNLKSKQAQDNYEAALAVVQSQVLAKYSSVKMQFKEWEQCFFRDNECKEPTLNDIRTDERGYAMYSTLRLCKQFLEHWQITVHLEI